MNEVFIVAQYKSGTSWLLAALSAHPSVLGIREIDIVKASYDRASGGSLAPRETRLRAFFGSSAWCADDVLSSLERGKEVGTDSKRSDFDRPQSYKDLEASVLTHLYEVIREASSPSQAVEGFLSAVSSGATDQTHIVLKAADQIAVLDHLERVRPLSPKIAIVRDGRDAAISAVHYRKLVEDKPWFSGHASYEDLLKGWAKRARMVRETAERGSVYVIRYEDLTADFVGTMTGILDELGLNSSPSIVSAINDRTSFEAMTGRQRGSSGVGVVRKGMVGEWREYLSEAQMGEAWELAGDALSSLGYTKAGGLDPLSRALRPGSGAREAD